MEWMTTMREPYQQSKEGTSRAHAHFYLYRVKAGDWRAGRFTFGRDVDFRLTFSSAKVARAYCERYDSDAVIIEEVTA
jgi:hypothetical protein